MTRRRLAVLLLGALVAGYLAACGSSGVSGVPPDVEPPPLRVPGVLLEIQPEDLTPGFGPTPNNLVNDIPGFLREHGNEILRAVGERAREPNVRSLGFQNPRQDKFLFVVQVALQEEQAAIDIVSFITTLEAVEIFGFISPGDVLFEAERLPDPPTRGASAHYFLRYGVIGDDGQRSRDVGADVLIFASGGTVVFMQGSAPQNANTPTRVRGEVLALGVILSERMRSEYAAIVEGLGGEPIEK